ncbi:aminotransferase class V [Beutenbergia cavernae DSM 12333]|uniref:cysteine desulfurase n=1 Tax=Beutenbergia cavernae (strain ATCC BAA-8 / DSM 12333 / CCUG 43141 / JCM 11478 / NBRC 16432 / NCIMB 13614 / HKI 0122) TaxID=471853 RepID=C5BYB8_BEUC1|nr:cysteine desulfurase family protein [Beutenbergia cavernae]ACQ81018.1 aminotransferase class V [Beutenbergia cavernae DSM 12333]
MSIYLDEAATTPLRRDVLEAMWPYLGPSYGNPSSHHEVGAAARRGLEEARADVAAVLGARPDEVTFTSGGTEADNAAVKGIALAAPRGRHVVVSAVEHPAVLESAAFLGRLGYAVDVLDVDRDGRVDPGVLEAALRADTTIVSVQHANNEVGTIQPVAELAALAARVGALFHSDAVQAAGWLDLDVETLGVDALSLSGHKLGAPKGVGVLWTRRGVPLEPLLHGGGQESGRRSGTENVAAAVGMAAAVRFAADARTLPDDDGASDAAVVARRDAFVARVLDGVPGAALTGHATLRLPGHASFVFAAASGEAVLLELEERGITCSSGSACAAGSDEPSPVLTAMGYDAALARTAVRFTFGRTRGAEDLTAAADAVVDAVARLGRLAGRV